MKAVVPGGGGSLGRTYGGYFTRESVESDMEKYGKLLFSSFAEILCFCACGNAASLCFVSNGTRLGMDGYLLWLLAVTQSCYKECFLCCSLVLYSVLIES